MTPTLRTLTFWIAAIAVAGFGAASIASNRPSGATDRALAVASLKHALAALDDEALESAARLSAYRQGLLETDELLRRALRLNPTDTSSIERLAMVRWESGVLEGGPDIDSVSALMAVAAARAPWVPEIQANLGELFYKMGRPDDATPFMKRAVELSPSITNRVVGTMLDAGVGEDRILATLPRSPEMVVTVLDRLPLSQDRRLELVESAVQPGNVELILKYFDECRVQGRLPRLLQRFGALGHSRDAMFAFRTVVSARAMAELNLATEAIASAKLAVQSGPVDAALLEQAGRVGLAAGDFSYAESCFRDALIDEAEHGGSVGLRARQYELLGRALENQQREGEAFDAYSRAVRLTPASTWAASRLRSWHDATQDIDGGH